MVVGGVWGGIVPFPLHLSDSHNSKVQLHFFFFFLQNIKLKWIYFNI